jgi:predicted dehydrogenase
MVADQDGQRAGEFGRTYGCSFTADNAELLGRKLDLVTVCVQNPNHFEVASEVVAAGHAVLCEKPMTRSAEHSRKLVEQVKAKGKPFFVGYMKRAHPTVQRYRELVGRIGRPRSGLVRVFHPCMQTDRENLIKVYKQAPDKPLDGVFVNSCSHMLDLLLYMAGPVKRIMSARMQYLPECPAADVSAHAMLEMENGATVMVECGWLPLSGVGRRENGWDEVLEFRGDEGLAKLFTCWWARPESEVPVAELWHEPSKTREECNLGSVDYFNSQYELIEQALGGKSVPLATVEDGCRVDELIDGIFDAAGI